MWPSNPKTIKEEIKNCLYRIVLKTLELDESWICMFMDPNVSNLALNFIDNTLQAFGSMQI